MRGKFEELAVIIQIASTISKRLPVRCIVVTKTLSTVVIKTLRPINEHRYLALYLFCGSRGCDHRNGRFVCNHRQCRSIGKSITVEVKREPVASIQELKAQYRRPTSISFPKDNPYTIGKGRPRQETVLRYAPVGSQSFVLCLLPQPCLRVGGWSAEGRRAWHEAARSSVSNHRGMRRSVKIFMWDGRASSLEEQALGPIRQT